MLLPGLMLRIGLIALRLADVITVYAVAKAVLDIACIIHNAGYYC